MIRNQKHIASLMLLLILFTSLSGCLGSEEDGSDLEESEMPDDSDSSPVFLIVWNLHKLSAAGSFLFLMV